MTRLWTRLWHGIGAALALFALVGQAILVIDADSSFVNYVSYFTIESNILSMIACALVALRPDRGGTAFGILRLGSLTMITVTGIVFATVLAGDVDLDGMAWWYDKVFHYVVPAMSVVGYLVFRPRTRLEWRHLWFLAFPVAWLAYTLVRAEVAEPAFQIGDATYAPVPYGFLDVGEHGAASVTVACVVVTAGAVAIAAAYVAFSRRERAPST